jgi:hypothetical protein
MDRIVRGAIEIELHPTVSTEMVASLSGNRGSLLSAPWNVRDMNQGHLVRQFHIHSVFTNNPALPFYRSLGPRFVLGPFTTHAPFPFPLVILNSEFHCSFLSRLVFLRSLRRLLVKASVVPSTPILVTLMKEALSSSGTSVLTRATRRNTPEDNFSMHSSFWNKHSPNYKIRNLAHEECRLLWCDPMWL